MQHDEIWILDFDRCLGNEVLYRDAEAAIERLSTDARDRLIAIRAKVESDGGSFDVISYLEQEDGTLRDEFLKIFDDITSLQGADAYRNTGTTALLEYLESRQIPHMIMTYGGELWQKAKLKAAGLDSQPYIVVDTKIKGEVILSWYQPLDQAFVIPFPDGSTRRSSSVCLVDDKALAFTGLSHPARGYWLRSEKMLKSQKGEVPSSVTPVDSLTDIVRLEKQVTNR